MIKIHGDLVENAIDIDACLDALIRAAGSDVPANALIAGFGLAAEGLLGTLTVTRENRGETIEIYATLCDQCGGEVGDTGHILCKTCKSTTELLLRRSVDSYSRLSALERRHLLVQSMVGNAAHLGCASCSNQPVRPCICARTFDIPRDVRQGQVLEGRHRSNGAATFGVAVEGTG